MGSLSPNIQHRAQSIKRVKKRSSGAPGRKGRPRKEACVDVPEDQAQETDAVSVTEPVLPTIAEPLTASENPLEGFLIEHLGPEEEKSLVTDTGVCEISYCQVHLYSIYVLTCQNKRVMCGGFR